MFNQTFFLSQLAKFSEDTLSSYTEVVSSQVYPLYSSSPTCSPHASCDPSPLLWTLPQPSSFSSPFCFLIKFLSNCLYQRITIKRACYFIYLFASPPFLCLFSFFSFKRPGHFISLCSIKFAKSANTPAIFIIYLHLFRFLCCRLV